MKNTITDFARRARARALVLGAVGLLVVTLAHLSVAAPAFTSFDSPGARYAGGVMTQPGAPVYFSSGATAGADATGDMRSQAGVTMRRLTENLQQAGLKLDDVAFVRAYLAPDATGKVDYAGWNAAWDEFFAQRAAPAKPARTTVGVPLLSRPGTLIEIEFVCLPARDAGSFASSAALQLPVTNRSLKPYGTRDARIYSGMGVVAESTMYWTAGVVAPVADDKVPPDHRDHRGDMKTQAGNTLSKLRTNLQSVGLDFDDVVFLRAFLAPDAHKGNTFDYDGWNAAYGEFFNSTANPHKPARTTVTTPSFGNPGTLLEVEVIAAFAAKPALFAAPSAHPKLKTYGEPDAMIAAGIAVDAPASFYFSAGAVPSVKGDLQTQAVSALQSLQSQLQRANLKFSDIVFLRAYVVPGADGKFDRAAWTAAYLQYFNNPQQPHKPARTTIQVHSLPNPDWMIEIDAIAVAR